MRILLPTDFSKNAWHAINYAVYLFENMRCTYYVMHAHQVSPSALISTINRERDTRLHEITQDEVEVKLHKLVGQLIKINKNANHSYEAILESDSLLNAVGRNVIDKDVDYICMGTQGASGLKEIFLGSNTVNIIKHINFCPVIAVPESYQFSRPDNIVFATDYKHTYQKIELDPLFDIIELWKSTLHVIHMKEEETLDEEQLKLKSLLKKLLLDISVQIEEVAYHPNIAFRINEWIDRNKVNMAAMMNSSHGFFRRLLHGPVIKKVAFKTHVPFLVLPEAI